VLFFQCLRIIQQKLLNKRLVERVAIDICVDVYSRRTPVMGGYGCVRWGVSVCVTAGRSRGEVELDARKRLCEFDVDSDDDDDSLLDSEVSELLRSRSPTVDHSPCKRLRQRSDLGPPSPSHAPSPPRPSLDFYKMQVGTRAVR